MRKRLRYVRRTPSAVAAERDVEVVAQPARQRHVPAPPEVLERQRPVGGVEVLREADAEQQRAADGDVGVAGEVGVDLDGVGVDADEQLERTVRGRRAEDGVDELGGDDSWRSPPS